MTAPTLLSAEKFIEHEGSNCWFDLNDPPTLFYCCFQKEYYTDDLFDQYSIEFPEQLNNAVVKRRAEFLAGRYCVSKALMQYGIENFKVGIGKHKNPLWPEWICGAISHCDNYAVAVVDQLSRCRGIGIDIEKLVSHETAERLQSQIIYGNESQLFLKEYNKELIFTLAFSVKESFFKAAYPSVRKYFDFDAVSITDIDFESKTILLETNYDLSFGIQKGQRVTGHFCFLPDKKLVTLVLL